MATLTRDAILTASDLPRERVAVPEWGGEVWVRALTGAERDSFEAALIGGDPRAQRMHFDNIRARLVALTVVDDHGERLFRDADMDALGKKSAAALSRVADVAMRLSAVTPEDVDALAKNSGRARSGASGLSSPSPSAPPSASFNSG